MKKCPYCAEDIKDEAIKCRYCLSDLTLPPPTTSILTPGASGEPERAPSPSPTDSTTGSPSSAAPSAPTPSGEPVREHEQTSPEPTGPRAIRYTHSGYRYVLGYGADFFGIWDRQSPAEPTERFPRTDDGWGQAWTRFTAIEPKHVEVPQPSESGVSQAAGPSMDPNDTDVVQYTHSGQRYLLGYGRTFFGIWDRDSPRTPVERFPRDDGGWRDAWRRFTSIETHYTEVGLGGSPR